VGRKKGPKLAKMFSLSPL